MQRQRVMEDGAVAAWDRQAEAFVDGHRSAERSSAAAFVDEMRPRVVALDDAEPGSLARALCSRTNASYEEATHVDHLVEKLEYHWDGLNAWDGLLLRPTDVILLDDRLYLESFRTDVAPKPAIENFAGLWSLHSRTRKWLQPKSTVLRSLFGSMFGGAARFSVLCSECLDVTLPFGEAALCRACLDCHVCCSQCRLSGACERSLSTLRSIVSVLTGQASFPWTHAVAVSADGYDNDGHAVPTLPIPIDDALAALGSRNLRDSACRTLIFEGLDVEQAVHVFTSPARFRLALKRLQCSQPPTKRTHQA